MDTQFRELFNQQFTEELYESYKRNLARRLDCNFEFRLAESPLFLPDDFKAQLTESARAIVDQLGKPENIERMKQAIPERWNTPGMDALPNFTQVDFAVTSDGPKLIELQGFPSLTSMQVIQRDAWNDTLQSIPGLDREWSCWYSGLDRDGFLKLARRTI